MVTPLWWFCVVWVSSVLIYSAVFKLMDYRHLPITIARYRLLPNRAVQPVALVLPWAELAGAGLLLVSPTRVVGGAVCALLGITFTVSTANVVRRRIDISCGCIGRMSDVRAGRGSVARAAMITTAAVFLTADPHEASLSAAVALTTSAVACLPAAFLVLTRRWARRPFSAQNLPVR
jgi:hypothetical protein